MTTIPNMERHLAARVTEADDALVRAAARREGKRVSAWMREALVERAVRVLSAGKGDGDDAR